MRNGNSSRRSKNVPLSTKRRGYVLNTWRNTRITSTDQEENPRPCARKAIRTVFHTRVCPWTPSEQVISPIITCQWLLFLIRERVCVAARITRLENTYSYATITQHVHVTSGIVTLLWIYKKISSCWHIMKKLPVHEITYTTQLHYVSATKYRIANILSIIRRDNGQMSIIIQPKGNLFRGDAAWNHRRRIYSALGYIFVTARQLSSVTDDFTGNVMRNGCLERNYRFEKSVWYKDAVKKLIFGQ